MTNAFATIKIESNILRVEVQKAKPEGNEFSKLITDCEQTYMSMISPFTLALDMSLMDEISMLHALQWMAMFFRVLPKTRELLICSCICLNKRLDKGVKEFLKLYNPVKPFYTFHKKEKFENFLYKSSE